MPFMLLARTGAGTLTLTEDKRGLAFEAVLPDTTLGRDTYENIRNKNYPGMSFGFLPVKNRTEYDDRGRLIRVQHDEVDLREITVTSMPAYPKTSVAVRSLATRRTGQLCAACASCKTERLPPMKTLKELMKLRAAKFDELEALAKQEETDETRAKFDELEAEIGKLDEDITRAKKLEQRRSEAAAQVPDDDDGGQDDQAAGQTRSQNPFNGRPTAAAAPAEQRNLANEFGMFVRSYAAAQCEQRDGKQVHPSQFAKRAYGDNHPVVANLERAQTASENSGGGFLITPNYMPEIIKLFGPNTIVRRNARSVPGNATYFKGKTGASVGYVGENEQGDVTGVTFGSMTMAEKDISAILPISKKLLRNTGYNVEAYCRDELVRASAEFEDLKFLYGTGVGKEVKGYYHSILSDNVFRRQTRLPRPVPRSLPNCTRF